MITNEGLALLAKLPILNYEFTHHEAPKLYLKLEIASETTESELIKIKNKFLGEGEGSVIFRSPADFPNTLIYFYFR